MTESDTDVAAEERSRGFFSDFFRTKGTKEVLIVAALLSLGIGCVFGLVPETIADRYARIDHGYTGAHCNTFDEQDKPTACLDGAEDAQEAAAWSNALQCLLSLLFNPVVGSFSDEHGRRKVIVASLFVLCLPPLVFLLLMSIPTFNPFWYYASDGLTGAVNFLSLVFATVSDIASEENRASAFGILLATFYFGIAFGPSVPVFLSPFNTAVASAVLVGGGFLAAASFFPETLSEDARRGAEDQVERRHGTSFAANLCHTMSRPLRDISILNRDWVVRLVALGSFFSSMVYASDKTLFVYYVENYLDVRTKDLAMMAVLIGVGGLAMQAGALHPLVKLLGEKGLLVASFASGTLHNFLYGLARGKPTIYVALCLSQLTKLNVPILASLASKDATRKEQGQIQGSLSAFNAIAAAIGPISMEFIYHNTKEKKHLGPGFMFYYAAGLYLIGSIMVALIPVGQDGAASAAVSFETTDLEEPLLCPAESETTENQGTED